jgi:hypothetical protein
MNSASNEVGREALERQIASIEEELGRAVLLSAAPQSVDGERLLPTPLKPGRTLRGDWIATPGRGVRAFSKAMVDAVIFFAQRQHQEGPQEEPMGVHVIPDDTERGFTPVLMARSPILLAGRWGNVALVDSKAFTPLDHGGEIPAWSFINTDEGGVPILSNVRATTDDLREPIYRVEDPAAAFYEDTDPTVY